jgi:hypothetical protein
LSCHHFLFQLIKNVHRRFFAKIMVETKRTTNVKIGGARILDFEMGWGGGVGQFCNN